MVRKEASDHSACDQDPQSDNGQICLPGTCRSEQSPIWFVTEQKQTSVESDEQKNNRQNRLFFRKVFRAKKKSPRQNSRSCSDIPQPATRVRAQRARNSTGLTKFCLVSAHHSVITNCCLGFDSISLPWSPRNTDSHQGESRDIRNLTDPDPRTTENDQAAEPPARL